MNPRERVVSNAMQTGVSRVKESDVLGVDELLRLRWIRDMPVVSGTRLVGVVSIGDLLRACINALRSAESKPLGIRIGDVMVRDVVTIDADATLGEAAELMKFHEIAYLPITDRDGQLIGTLSESDLVTATLR